MDIQHDSCLFVIKASHLWEKDFHWCCLSDLALISEYDVICIQIYHLCTLCSLSNRHIHISFANQVWILQSYVIPSGFTVARIGKRNELQDCVMFARCFIKRLITHNAWRTGMKRGKSLIRFIGKVCRPEPVWKQIWKPDRGEKKRINGTAKMFVSPHTGFAHKSVPTSVLWHLSSRLGRRESAVHPHRNKSSSDDADLESLLLYCPVYRNSLWLQLGFPLSRCPHHQSSVPADVSFTHFTSKFTTVQRLFCCCRHSKLTDDEVKVSQSSTVDNGVVFYSGNVTFRVQTVIRFTRVITLLLDETTTPLPPAKNKADELYRKVRVLCWVLTSPEHHATKAKAVKETWGKRCNILLFMSTAEGI